MIEAGVASAPSQSKLGPACVRNEMKVRSGMLAKWATRGRVSENRCIHSRCRSMRTSFAAKCPGCVMETSAFVARTHAAYWSGSENRRTMLAGMPHLPRWRIVRQRILALIVGDGVDWDQALSDLSAVKSWSH